ncbi:jhamt [Trichonephila clavata]|uniref:Jhamt n=1 Tax=Trichonephila clavata TaxID=2740835 RepID=A0A8X6F774_TRICU|nr:jhamt [Trichonephila clavata]
MAESSLSSQTSVQYDDSIKFIKSCADEFQWKDLSEDVVMDIGCGHELNCCKAILMQFPEVKALIAVDNNRTVLKKHTSGIEGFGFASATYEAGL